MFVIHQHNFFLFRLTHLLHNLVFQLFVVQLQDAEINVHTNINKIFKRDNIKCLLKRNKVIIVL